MSAQALILRIPASFWRFGLVGVGGLFVDMAVLYAVIWGLGWAAIPAKVVSFLAAATFTWWMNRRYTFGRSGKSLLHEWASFLATNAFGGAVNFAVYTAIVAQPALAYVWIPALATAAGSLSGLLFNYTASKHLVFKPRPRQADPSGANPPPARFRPLPWLLVLAAFGGAWWIKSQLFEQQAVVLFCRGGGEALACTLRQWIEPAFSGGGLGYLALALGVLAAATRSGLAGLLAALTGAAGLVLYCGDYAAVGFLLGFLALARAERRRYQHRAAEH